MIRRCTPAEHGTRFAAEIRRYTDERVRLATNGTWAGRPATRDDVLDLAERMLPAHRAYAPDLYAEMLSLASSAGISAAEAVIVGGFTDFVDVVRAGGSAVVEDDCTAVLAPGGWFAQTWDMHDSATEHVVLLEVDGALVFTTVGCVGQIGMNADGLCVGITNLTANDGRVGVTWPFVVRRMLQTLTLEEALGVLLEAPLAGGHAYLVMDATGSAARVEATPTWHQVTRLQERALTQTNHLQDPDGRRREAVRPPELHRSSVERLARVSGLEVGDLAGLMAMTRDPVICRRSEPPFHLETLGAVVMRPSTRELWAVWGNPMDAEYERFVVTR